MCPLRGLLTWPLGPSPRAPARSPRANHTGAPPLPGDQGVCLPCGPGTTFLLLGPPALSGRPRGKALALQEGSAGREQPWAHEVSMRSAALSGGGGTPTSRSPAHEVHAQQQGHSGPHGALLRQFLSPAASLPDLGRDALGTTVRPHEVTRVGRAPREPARLRSEALKGCTPEPQQPSSK